MPDPGPTPADGYPTYRRAVVEALDRAARDGGAERVRLGRKLLADLDAEARALGWKGPPDYCDYVEPPGPFGDADMAYLLRTYPGVAVIGNAGDFGRLAYFADDDVPEPSGRVPEWLTPGGAYIARTETGDDGTVWRRWHWEPDAEGMVRRGGEVDPSII